MLDCFLRIQFVRKGPAIEKTITVKRKAFGKKRKSHKFFHSSKRK